MNTSEFAFNTVLVRQKCASSLKDSDGGGVLTGKTYQHRYNLPLVHASQTSFDPNGTELLPIKTKVCITYGG
jgi:hypothetical protein